MNQNEIENERRRYAAVASDALGYLVRVAPELRDGFMLEGTVADYPTLEAIESILSKRHHVGEHAVYEWTIYNFAHPRAGAGKIHVEGTRGTAPPEHMLQWFKFEHLPPHLQETSKPFANLANLIVQTLDPGPERTVALRFLLQSKDAAVRAKLVPGG